MKLINCKNSLKPEDFTSIEERLESFLPNEYRDFMLEHNGGNPETDILYQDVDTE